MVMVMVMVMEMLLLLVTKLFSLICLATLAWWHFLRGVVDFHVELCFKVLASMVALVSLPTRILTALERERTLDVHLHNLEARLENVIWEKKELEERLHRAIKERKVMEAVLEEIDMAHEKALSRIDWLESKLQDLKEENIQSNEVQGKALWDYKACDDVISKHSFGDSIVDEMLERQRVVALSRSLFSSIMSLVVAMIIWEAEDPCVPLVAPLFSVVGMSLNSVLRFFSTIKNRVAFDAVALLSVNWFILGTLTYPALPGAARVLAPRVITWLGFSP